MRRQEETNMTNTQSSETFDGLPKVPTISVLGSSL